jgi:crotonobetainyl-CoA:carnitine CoA-transferase CaiB-like acyl-CoA transferase
MRPLDGLLVLDFSTLLPGPLATLILAEAGAEVVKVERPGGDEMRAWEPRWGSQSINFALLNRGKNSIVIDLKDAQHRAKLEPLIARADVLVEQFRPGVMTRLGLDYASASAINPRIIYCSITGYGQTGPKRDVAAHDVNYIAESGLLSLSRGSLSHPVVPPALIADIAGGSYPAVMNILLALRERERTGRGRHLDVSMSDNLFTLTYWALGRGFATGEWPGNGTDLVTGGSPRYQLYPTRDGRILAVGAIEQRFWDSFCDVVGLDPALRNDTSDPTATIARLRDIVASEDAAVWSSRIAGRDCCCSIVATLREALDNPQFAARGLMAHRLVNEAGARLPALPVPVDAAFRASAENALSAPLLGADNARFGVERQPAPAAVKGNS